MFSTVDRYLMRQILLAWVAITAVLFLILLSVMLGRILQEVAQGLLAPGLLGTVVALKSVGALNLMMPFSLFMACMLVLGRMYRDSEIVVLWACGVGDAQLYRAFMIVAVPAFALLLVMSLWTAPWAAQKSFEIREAVARAPELSMIQPGRFQQGSGSSRVFYIESIAQDRRTAQDLFIHDETELGTEIITARRGWQQVNPDTGERFMVLEDGFRYEGRAGLGNFRVLEFARSRFKIAERGESGVRRKQESIPTRQLLGSDLPEDRAELHWRLSPAIMILILMFVALPLARTRPREGLYSRLLVAVLFFVVYSNLLAVGYSWLEDGKLPAAAGLWWAHGLAVMIGWLAARRWRRRSRGASREAATA